MIIQEKIKGNSNLIGHHLFLIEVLYTIKHQGLNLLSSVLKSRPSSSTEKKHLVHNHTMLQMFVTLSHKSHIRDRFK